MIPFPAHRLLLLALVLKLGATIRLRTAAGTLFTTQRTAGTIGTGLPATLMPVKPPLTLKIDGKCPTTALIFKRATLTMTQLVPGL